jgi:hypothetical protein
VTELDDLDETPEFDPGNLAINITRYTIPYWVTHCEERAFTLESRGHIGEDRWALLDAPHCFNKRTGEFEYELRPSSRDDDFLRDCRMTLEEAIPHVKEQVALKRVAVREQMTRILQRNAEREAAKAKTKEGPSG